MTMCIYVEIMWCNDGDEVWMLYIQLGDNWWCEYLLYPCEDELRFCCICLVNWLRMHLIMALLEMNMCIYMMCDPNTIHAFIFPLCWIYILTYVWQMVACTLLWCRLAGWGCIVNVSFWGRLGAYSSFTALILELCLAVFCLGCRGFYLCYWLCWGTLSLILMMYWWQIILHYS